MKRIHWALTLSSFVLLSACSSQQTVVQQQPAAGTDEQSADLGLHLRKRGNPGEVAGKAPINEAATAGDNQQGPSKIADANRAYNQGIILAKQRQFSEAVAAYDEAIKLDPKCADCFSHRATANNWLKKYDKALADCETAIKLDPKLASAYSTRAFSYFSTRQFDDAVADASKAIDLDEKDSDSYFTRGDAYIGLKQYQKAINDFEKAISVDPSFAGKRENSWIYRNLALCYNQAGQYEKAIKACDKTIFMNPGDALAYGTRASAYKHLGKDDLARLDYDKYQQLTVQSR